MSKEKMPLPPIATKQSEVKEKNVVFNEEALGKDPGALLPDAVVSKADDKKSKDSKPILVRAVEEGFYKNIRRQINDEFYIDSEKKFSEFWMVKV